ncbi:hypothetical protein L0B52_04285 [Suttonella sp. R2A3]|uniref:DNA-3-methyladenine glycosylase family protein n=1 Tax=Suttonella sp. R2A3 TaxID=2908648 RepID=UPI001F436D1C|nr:hypothetical protein [Suttonella sp. R2A3]UJF25371.1 hypothetical protein L0B52_04285 [Suttonella sp. R2A3]
MTPSYWQQATDALSKRDATMAELISRYPDSCMQSRGRPFVTLLRAIVGQQISVKAADAIWARLNDTTALNPQHVAQIDRDTLRSLGLSRQKADYMHAVCTYFLDNDIHDDYFSALSDSEIISELSAIHGIGRWSAEMFLMFTLLRPNVFPVADLGLLRALEKHYHGARLTPAQARDLYQKRFDPWCSVATWYLWRSLDPVEIQY